MQRNATHWTPTLRQARVLTAATDAGLNRTIAAVCAEAGIAPSTFYRWYDRTPEFKDAWDNIWKAALARHLPGVITAQLHKAQTGDTQAARLIADIAGIIKTRLEHSGPDSGPIEVTDARERLARQLAGIIATRPTNDPPHDPQ